ncbi:MAG: DUF2062 domain-containing protein [Alphaproteobacteria bacterium]|nr:DUF2062 domain-containing protein [Alphaproteobacteria bacterium]
MFKRREPLNAFQTLREIFWPSMGWRRSFRYARHRIVRMSDSSHRIAAGLATGASISLTPIVGTHFIQAGLIAVLIRANVLMALMGTFLGNPWTFPFMWWESIRFGSFLFGLFGMPVSTALPEHVNFTVLWTLITQEPLRLFLPWMVGGYTLAFLLWPVFYGIFYYLLRAAKNRRIQARTARPIVCAQDPAPGEWPAP